MTLFPYTTLFRSPQPVTHSVAMTEGGMHSKPIDVKMDATTNSLAMATKGYRSYEVNPNSTKKSGFTDKSKLKCSNCGGTRHTREGCFELIGYPDWWKDPRKKKQGDNS